MDIYFPKVTDQVDINRVSTLAREIWTEHFTTMIGSDQVEYMLNKFQSVEAISSQIHNGTEYYLTMNENEQIGYVALISEKEISKMMISKIYLKKSTRGQGTGKRLLEFIEHRSAQENIVNLWLTVNRHNSETIKWYQRQGFKITQEVKKEIGNGFFMDDYIMEKILK